jgi:hypothetical protein
MLNSAILIALGYYCFYCFRLQPLPGAGGEMPNILVYSYLTFPLAAIARGWRRNA